MGYFAKPIILPRVHRVMGIVSLRPSCALRAFPRALERSDTHRMKTMDRSIAPAPAKIMGFAKARPILRAYVKRENTEQIFDWEYCCQRRNG